MSKQEILEIIGSLPDNVSLDEVMYRLYLENNVSKGLNDIKCGNTHTQQQIRELFS